MRCSSRANTDRRARCDNGNEAAAREPKQAPRELARAFLSKPLQQRFLERSVAQVDAVGTTHHDAEFLGARDQRRGFGRLDAERSHRLRQTRAALCATESASTFNIGAHLAASAQGAHSPAPD